MFDKYEAKQYEKILTQNGYLYDCIIPTYVFLNNLKI